MRRTPNLPRRRGGFTLVELLVAAALSLVVMTVLSLAFQTGMQTLSQLKSVVGMADQLRAAESVLRRDLQAYHLEADQGLPVRVSDGGGLKGYFSFTQGGTAQTTSGPQGFGPFNEHTLSASDPDNPQSYRTPAASGASALFGRAWMDTLAFTVRLDGTRPQEVFTASAVGDPTNVNGTLLARVRATDPSALPAETQSADPTNTQLTNRWAEVAYLLVPSGTSGSTLPKVFTSDEGGVTGLPLYTLFRRQRVLADHTVQSPAAGTNAFGATDAQAARGVAMASNGVLWSVLGPEVMGVPANRLGGTADLLAPALAVAPSAMQPDLGRRGYPIPTGTAEYGSDVLLNNVVSMTVRPVYEFDVSAAVLGQLQSLVSAGTVTLTPNQSNTLVPIPKSLGTPSYIPIDWLELVAVPAGSSGNRATLPAPGSLFPRFYDTAGPSQVGVLFRNGVGGSQLNVTWDQTPGVFEVSAKLKAIEIKLRVYDSRNKTTRQITVLQDL